MKKVALSLIMTALLAACASTPVPTTTPADQGTNGSSSNSSANTNPAVVDLTQGQKKHLLN